MGRLSTKENKNIYQISRETAGLSRAKAEGETFISADRLVDIENKKTPHPEEVVAMANGYKDPFLCNYYCANECAIGCESVSPQEKKTLSRISMEMLNALNYLEEEKNRFIEIVSDDEISPCEMEDFDRIQERLKKMEAHIDALQLWVKQCELTGKLPEKSDRLL